MQFSPLISTVQQATIARGRKSVLRVDNNMSRTRKTAEQEHAAPENPWWMSIRWGVGRRQAGRTQATLIHLLCLPVAR